MKSVVSQMRNISTFSIVARDPKTGELGIAVQSKFLAVGAVVPWLSWGWSHSYTGCCKSRLR